MQAAQRPETLGRNRKQRRAAIAYLRGLQKQAYNWQRATGVKRSRDDSFRSDGDLDTDHPVDDFGAAEQLLGPRPGRSSESADIDLSCNIWTSPFTLPTTVFKDAHQEQRKWIWLAPASPWSLTARLIVMMTEIFDQSSAKDPPQLYLDGDIYPFAWDHASVSGPIDTSDLPSLDYALYLYQIVQFRLGQAYRFFEEDSFIKYLHRFYETRPDAKATEPRFLFVQFLLVLALGNAFIARPRNKTDPPGSKYFLRAMSAMPTNISTGKNSLFAIEALALVGLYLYAIDHREAAHVHVGHAIRIAQLEGMHTQLPEDVLGDATVTRCRNLWWSLYIMDRHISPSLGLPMALQDSDITTLINSPLTSRQNLTFSLQVRITRMLSFIIGTIYKTEKTQLVAFLDITRSILETMAKYAEEIENMINTNFHGSGDNLPEETCHTILLYHQCIIVATRPLLLSVLKERLEKLGRAEEDWQKFLVLPRSLISIGIKSAGKTLQIIGNENGLLETFLPFDHEMTYAAALHLTMANALFPSSMHGRSYSKQAHDILDELINCGNRVAHARKQELSRIEGLLQEFARRVEQAGLRVLTLSDPTVSDITPLIIPQGIQLGGAPGANTGIVFQPSPRDNQSGPAHPSATANVDFLESIGISSYEFLSVLDQINHPEIYSGEFGMEPDWLGGEDVTVTDSFS
ncbi:uncharacterized protein N7503_000936 [Penicillium pulvis]|uniref:uncharacterized protein n=1 Tax=Penicillium pulvis TaxID=1562058 RepID=UPI0025492A9F|nr:uncharacterized protein N7503_000936 [Penicillium pulvis]KAJ5814186.1 hypothetical protein N7503_000936 [Penicillium pulvis]